MSDTNENPNAVQTREAKREELGAFLFRPAMQKQLELAIPKTVKPDRLARLALTLVQKTPELLDCTRASFLGSLMECAALGLEPGILGQAWIIPYKRTATLIVGYRGMITLAWRSALVRSVQAREIYRGESFDFEPTALEPLRHFPNLDQEPDDEKIIGAWGLVRTVNGGTIPDFMNRAAIERIRSRSRAGNSGPWISDFPEMAKKTVLRRLLKGAPQSAELQRAMQLEDEFEGDGAQSLPTLEGALAEDLEGAKAEKTTTLRGKIAKTREALEDGAPPVWAQNADGSEFCSECGVSRGELGGHAANCSFGSER